MAHKLTKDLGLWHSFAICTGAMISSGLFVLPGIAARETGPLVIFAYLLSGVLLLPAMFSMAELATAMPRAGGTYFFISRSLGSMFGTIEGVGDWLALTLKTSIALLGLGAYLSGYLPMNMIAIALICCVIFAVANLVGAKEAAGVQLGMVLGLIGILAFFIVRGLPAIDPSRLRPLAPMGFSKILPTAAFVFISYIGLTKISSVSEEVRHPERNIPLAMFLSLIVTMCVYGLVVWILVGTLPPEELYVSKTPLSDAAAVTIGKWGAHAISLAAILAFATTANAGILSASRYLLAMSRDRAIPHAVSRFSKFKTPRNAILITAGVAALVLVLTGLEQIAKMASTFQLLVFAFVNVAVIVMRESKIQSYDPGFKSPLYPFMQIAGIFISIILIPEMGMISSVFATGLVALGVLWHYLYVRHHVTRVGAVAKVAQRVGEILLERDAEALGLKKELREILKEKGLRRDDPFARAVHDADVMEIGLESDSEGVIERGAIVLARRSGIDENIIREGLLERNRLGETPAAAGIALPHLLLDEVDGFYMVMARMVHGMDFAMADQGIHAVFLLLGSKKDPGQHLRFLAAIARRAEDPEFIQKWIEAGSPQELKSLLLLEPGV